MLAPLATRCVAQVCRHTCGVTLWDRPESRAYRRIMTSMAWLLSASCGWREDNHKAAWS
jgi:hypothetical protein